MVEKRSFLAHTFSRVSYPLFVAGALLGGHALLSAGLSAAAVAAGVIVSFSLAIAALERLVPHAPEWNRSRGDVLTDLAYLPTAKLPDVVATGAGHALAAVLAVWANQALGARLWPATWHPVAQFLVLLLVADLAKYWLHRLSHERPWLWRFHAVHHAPSRVYVLNGLRLHPVNLLWLMAFDVTLPLALGISPEVIAMFAVLVAAVAVLQHANVEMHAGPLNWVLSTPELHRWHHSTKLAEGHRNYGATLILWDLVFGTRLLPSDRPRPAAVGLAGTDALPRRWLGQMLWPVCGARLAIGCVPARLRNWVR